MTKQIKDDLATWLRKEEHKESSKDKKQSNTMINSQADRNIFVKKQTEFSNTKKIQQN